MIGMVSMPMVVLMIVMPMVVVIMIVVPVVVVMVMIMVMGSVCVPGVLRWQRHLVCFEQTHAQQQRQGDVTLNRPQDAGIVFHSP